MASVSSNARENALLVIDVQDSFKAGPRWNLRNNPSFEDNINRLIDGFRSRGLLITYFLDNGGSEHFSPKSPLYRFMEFMREPRPDEPVIHKYSRNCFTSTNLLQILLRKGARKVTIAGIKTEQCCETTARVASDLGFDVDFVTEATLTFPISKGPSQGELSTEQVVERTECALRDRFAKIKSVDEVLAGLG